MAGRYGGQVATTEGVPDTLPRWEDGERFFATALGNLADVDLDGPSLLPGWPRRMVIAHVARNADALVNLLHWARTGEETPMYPSAQARDEGIATTAELAAPDLRADCLGAAERLAAAVGQLPPAGWASAVRTAQGRTVPASEVPWMRVREVWVHGVDLDAGSSFSDVPADILGALVDDITAMWARRGETPPLRFSAAGRTWGSGPATVSGELPDLAAWLTGRAGTDRLRADGPLVDVPPWL